MILNTKWALEAKHIFNKVCNGCYRCKIHRCLCHGLKTMAAVIMEVHLNLHIFVEDDLKRKVYYCIILIDGYRSANKCPLDSHTTVALLFSVKC